MPNKKRKYDFDSDVKVPDIEEISRIAKDFSDPTISKGNIKNTDPLSKRGQVAKLDTKLTEAQKQMQLLAREVIKEEKNKAKDEAEVVEVAPTDSDEATTVESEESDVADQSEDN
ncbi:MAG: hypothetical protein GXY06_01740 [Clostridiaceae bacterium]|nr:hypothetical protein [Clostridiaceae bacterium]